MLTNWLTNDAEEYLQEGGKQIFLFMNTTRVTDEHIELWILLNVAEIGILGSLAYTAMASK